MKRFGVIVSAVLVAGCGRSPVESESDIAAGSWVPLPRPAEIVISPDSVKLRVGQVLQLGATVLDASGNPIPGAPVAFASGNSRIVQVTRGGLVTARSVGVTVVKARAGSVSIQVPAVIRRVPPLAVAATLALGGSPYGVALAPNGIGYVTQFRGASVTRFRVAEPTLTGSVPVGSFPAHVGLAPSGATAYVVNQLSTNVMVVDVAGNTVTRTIALGARPREAYNVLVSPDGAHVYLTTNDGVVFDMNATTFGLQDSAVVGGAANGLALDPTVPQLYVSSILAATVTAINTATFDVERVYPVGGRLQRIAVSPSGRELYAANNGSLSIVNLASGAVTSVPLGAEAIGLALAGPGDYVYLSLWALGRVAVVDVADRSLLGYVTTGGDPRNIAIGANGTVVIANQSGWIDVVR